MILTQCPVCAAQLPDLTAKQCSRCKTRYCGPACQKKHWEEGGHANLCKKIKKGGGAEQYHADKKYAEALGAATMACVEDTRGQTCYICTEAVHRHTGEGLVRGCACHTTEGFVHVSCLAEQAKILLDEVEENNLGVEALIARSSRWYSCSLCEQEYHGLVRCALGWACWKTYLDRPETDNFRRSAMTDLGNGLYAAGHHEDELIVREAEVSTLRRVGAPEHNILVAQSNLSSTYSRMGRFEQAMQMDRNVYSGRLKLHGEEHNYTLSSALNYVDSLMHLEHFDEAKSLLRKTTPAARRHLGKGHMTTLKMRKIYAKVLYNDDGSTLDDLREAVTTLEDLERTTRRMLGGEHPFTLNTEGNLRNARAALRARETGKEVIVTYK